MHHKTLFLHGGPGLSSEVERLWFKNSLPIDWWDQPINQEEKLCLGSIVEASLKRLNLLYQETNQKVDVIAHSFAGQIAFELSNHAGGLINKITLINCPSDSILAIERLAEAMLNMQQKDELGENLQLFRMSRTLENFKKLVLSLATHSAFPAVYFGPSSKEISDRFEVLMKSVRFLDIDTFFSVMENYLHEENQPKKSTFSGEVKFLLGRYDPLVNLELDVSKWEEIYPQLELEILDAGHYMQFELPPKYWFG